VDIPPGFRCPQLVAHLERRSDEARAAMLAFGKELGERQPGVLRAREA
jgi:hypothetical protein